MNKNFHRLINFLSSFSVQYTATPLWKIPLLGTKPNQTKPIQPPPTTMVGPQYSNTMPRTRINPQVLTRSDPIRSQSLMVQCSPAPTHRPPSPLKRAVARQIQPRRLSRHTCTGPQQTRSIAQFGRRQKPSGQRLVTTRLNPSIDGVRLSADRRMIFH